jgi:tetratricopeptide (TPR) repeat protein
VGRIQGHPISSNLGRVDDAMESLRTSLGLWRRLAEARPGDADARFEAVETQVLLADIHRMRGENRRAGALLDSAEATVDSLRATEEPDIPLLSTLAMVYERQANQAEAAGDAEATAAYVGEMSELARRTARLTPEGPARVGALEEVVLALQAESWVHSKLARSEEAVRVQRRAAELADSLADLPGTTQRMEGIRAGAWSQLGWRYNDADRPREAEAAFTRAVESLREMVDEDPRNQAAIASLGHALEGRGQARIRGERWEAALDDHGEAVDLLTPLLETLPATAFVVAQAHRQAGEAYSRLGRWD